MRGLAAAILVMSVAGCSWFYGEDNGTSAPAGSAGSSSAVLDQGQVTQELQNQGYGNINNLRQSGNDWTGSATNESGDSVIFDVDPYGAIHVK